MKKILIIICTFLYISTSNLFSQNIKIKGRIINEDFDSVSMASILINDKVEVGKTNMDGFFQIEIPISVKKLSFRFYGFEPATIELKDKCDEIEVILMLNITYDFFSPKKVDKLRRKRFKKLTQLHKKAFDKDLFKTEKPCYIREFKISNADNVSN